MITAGLILAAGVVSEHSVRKPTDHIGGASSIKRIIMVFRQAGIKKIAVVTGYNAEETENHCGHVGAVFLRNDDYETGDMLSSVKIGLDYLKDKCERVFIAPADVSLFSVDTVKSMEDASGQMVIPVCRNNTGHPLLLSRDLFDRVLEYNGALGIGDALSGEDIERRFLVVSDEGILIDTQNNKDISEVVEKHGLRNIRVEAKIQLVCEKGFFGPGTLLLLTLVTETGSLKHAAKRMGVSHSKAIKMIAVAEDQLGYELLESKRGGGAGGTSKVTDAALDFMRRYEALESESNELVQTAFDKHFG